ncbi:hypothetical protein N9834_01880 [Akkermansiaceae bacterium]|nr:hypothetical protein [Akkermansiaceae bacterium]MDB4272328.1 hypothetical protein [bacterium]MDB4262136.1 hypothetical protein [Akkermansiaceae bacterium]MDB4289045.1 hypothetical protein [bacterium]MDB4363762.1 hypothetical protein [Akkermansiaceae bacterium]
MSSRNSLILAHLILVAAGGYFWWRGQASQQIEKKVDLFIETAEFRKLSLTTVETRHEACRELFARVVEVDTPEPAPSGTYSRDEVTEQLDRFHSYISFFEIEESNRKIALDSEIAEAEVTGVFQVAFGPKSRENVDGSLTLSFEKKEEDWKIVRVKVIEN